MARSFRGEISGGVANFWLFSHATSKLDKPSAQTGSLKGPVIQLLDRGTQREYGSKLLKHSIVKRILVFKQ